MTAGIPLVVYPVTDLEGAKALFKEVLGIEPYVDEPYYVGFRVGDQEIGLNPNGHKTGTESVVPFMPVTDIRATMASLIGLGATEVQEPRDVGGGKLVASVADSNGNLIGLMQEP